MIPVWRAMPVADELAARLRDASRAVKVIAPDGTSPHVDRVALRCTPAPRLDLFGQKVGSLLALELLRMIDARYLAWRRLEVGQIEHADTLALWQLSHLRTGYPVDIFVDAEADPGASW